MKPKWKTTEFWVQVLAIVATFIGMVADKVPLLYGEILLAVQAGIYAWSRQAAKRLASEEAAHNKATLAPAELIESKGIDETVHEAVAIGNEALSHQIAKLSGQVQSLTASTNGKTAPPNLN